MSRQFPVIASKEQRTAAVPIHGSRAVNAFISYRVVAEDVARCRQVRTALEARGIEVHGDWELSAGPDYKPQLQALIRAADAFVVLMSPQSVISPHVNEEISYAAELKKRILPVLIASGINELKLRPELANPQWTRLRSTDHFDTGIDALVRALETDFDLTAVHTWLTQRAETWESRGRAHSALLNRREVKEASDWLPRVSANTRKFPNVTPIQQEFITASELASIRRLRILVGIAAAIAVLLAALGVTVAVYAVKATDEAERAQLAEGAARKEAERARNAEGAATRAATRASEEAARADRERDTAQQAATAERRARLEEERQRQIANEQRNAAEEQRRIAAAERDLARRQAFANAAYALADRDPTVAVQFARNAGIGEEDGVGAVALLKALNTGSWLYSHRLDDAFDADLSADGHLLAWIDRSHSLHLLQIDTNHKLAVVPMGTSRVRLLPSGRVLTWSGSGWKGPGERGTISLISRSGKILITHHLEFIEPIVCGSGKVFVPSFNPQPEPLGDRRMLAYALDPETGSLTTFELPGVESLVLKSACLPDDSGIVVAQTFPSVMVIAQAGGMQAVIPIPDGYHPSDIAVHPRSRQLAVYLAGAIRGVTDAVARLDLGDSPASGLKSLQLVALPDSPSFNSGGVVAFLPDGRVVAASTDGWARLVDFSSSSQVTIPARERAVDTIGVVEASSEFLMARRSGQITIFDSGGVAIGRLVGEFHSDGLNVVFERIVASSAGDRVLTVSRNGAKLWRRPRFQLTIPHTASFRPFDEIPTPILSALTLADSVGQSAIAQACGSTGTIKVDDVGQLSLCVQILSRTEYLNTGLKKGDIDIRGSGPVKDYLFHWIADEVDRLFLLSPDVALRLIEQEDRDRRLWQPDANTVSSWVRSGPGSIGRQ